MLGGVARGVLYSSSLNWVSSDADPSLLFLLELSADKKEKIQIYVCYFPPLSLNVIIMKGRESTNPFKKTEDNSKHNICVYHFLSVNLPINLEIRTQI